MSNNKTAKTVEIVDIASLLVDDANKAIKAISLSKPERTIKCDVFIAGGGLGGVAAALKIWQLQQKRPLRIVLSEETDWLGGQATAQGVSALDENFLVETTGCTANYQKLRHAIRNNYKSNHIVVDSAGENTNGNEKKYFNPGNCWVSHLAFEPKVALDEIKKMLAAALAGVDENRPAGGYKSPPLQVLYRHKPYYAKHNWSGKIKSIHLVNLDNNERVAVKAKLFLDATECGDLLAISGQKYATGEESREQTGEPHAPSQANPENVQDFTYPFVVEYRPSEEHIISKPDLYDELNKQGQFSFDGYKMFAESSRMTPEGEKQVLLPFWTYRRLIDAGNFKPPESVEAAAAAARHIMPSGLAAESKTYVSPPAYNNDISMINWASNDVRGKNIIDQPPATQARRLAYGKLVSLGFLYWLQTEAPRDDNAGKGYPELLLRKDILDTADGLSKHPYIRESRRIKAKYTIVEQDIAKASHPGKRAKLFADSAGIGLYPIDIHGEEAMPGTGQIARPFQIPLSSLVPQKFNGVLPAGKNIGVTHITNGAYRLHPIEWAIGEAQGALSFYCLNKKIAPEKVLANLSLLRDFQKMLIESGAPVYWFSDLPPEHPAFAAGQYLALIGAMPGTENDLHFYPDKPITPEEIDLALSKTLGTNNSLRERALQASPLQARPYINLAPTRTTAQAPALPSLAPTSRAQFAIWLYEIAQSKKLFGKI